MMIAEPWRQEGPGGIKYVMSAVPSWPWLRLSLFLESLCLPVPIQLSRLNANVCLPGRINDPLLLPPKGRPLLGFS